MILAYRDSGADEEGEYESNDVVTGGKEVNVNRVENNENREAPGDAIDDNFLSTWEKLVDDCSEEE
jgi:hypothetical protein